MEPRQGRKIFVRKHFLSPLPGSAPLSGLTPGLCPGLLSSRPSGACLTSGTSFATETDWAVGSPDAFPGRSPFRRAATAADVGDKEGETMRSVWYPQASLRSFLRPNLFGNRFSQAD
jgi:hypothetical protein